jgi:murein DD-endopeptidase MepM/ murein hydrolase activator NlpD
MWRASAVAVTAALMVLPALVGEEAQSRGRRVAAPVHAEARDALARSRDALARQVADELAAIDRALSAVGAKLGEADAARARRLAAAYRLLRRPTADPAGDPDALVTARRRAAVRLLLERDLAERRLLAGEDAQLRRAADVGQDRTARVPEVELPAEIGRPARGKIVRRFGAALHERSKATLSRRGIELDVDAQAPAVSPADGVVRYAGPIRGLDAGVILDHGDFLTVIGKLGAVSVPAGAPVRRGERIGRAARHRVYLEVRVALGAGGIPIDPEPLLARPRR